jgi:hypothetical protein
MAFIVCTALLMMLVPVTAESIGDIPYTYVLESMLLVIIVLLQILLCVGCFCCMQLHRAPEVVGGKTLPKRVSTSDVALQCDLLQRQGDAPSVVYITTTGSRFHTEVDCRHLRGVLRVNQMTPCRTCCP